MSGYLMPKSAIGRVRAYYVANPEETLTNDDLCIKFRLPKKRVDKLLFVLRHVGFLEAEPGSKPIAYRRTATPIREIRWRPQRELRAAA